MTRRVAGIDNPKTLKSLKIYKKKVVNWGGLFLTLLSSCIHNGCDSAAQVEWENQSRTAMGNKLDGIVTDRKVSVQYRSLTAQLNEEERALVNTLLEIILTKDSIGFEVGASVETTIVAFEHFIQQSTIRERLGEVLTLMIRLAEVSDVTLRANFEGAVAAKTEQKFEYLKSSIALNEYAAKNEDFRKVLDSQLPQVPIESLSETALIWSALESEADIKSQQMETVLNVAVFASEINFNKISSQLKAPSSQEPLMQLLNKLNLSDNASQDFLAAIASLDATSYTVISKLIDSFNNPNAAADLKTALAAAIRKAAAVESLLRADFIQLLANALSENDAVVRMNRINASTDSLQGSGFFDNVIFSNRHISNSEPLTCTLVGKGVADVQYSFKWTDGAAITLFDWSTPSADSSNTSNTFGIGDTTQCFVRILKNGIQVSELAGEKVTVKSAPPEFESGFSPRVSEVSISKGSTLTHTAEIAVDPNADDLVSYRLKHAGNHGNAIQTSPTTFEYTPLPNFVGNDEFSYSACDQYNMCSVPKIVRVKVSQTNSRPIIYEIRVNAAIPNNQVVVNAASRTITLKKGHIPAGVGELSLLLSDDELGPVNCSSVVTITSKDATILENTPAVIQIEGLFPNCTFSITPVATASGLTEINVSVIDGVDPVPASNTYYLNVQN